jgi:hypothetical protein
MMRFRSAALFIAGLVVSWTALAGAAGPIPLPSPGTPVVSNLTSTTATLTWAPSAGPVFRYSMKRLVNGEWTGYASMPSTTVNLAGLTPGDKYTFAVYAVALVGSGYTLSPLSEPVTFVTVPIRSTDAVP